MVAFELVKDPKTKEPDAALTASIVAHAEKRGLILLSCGTEANVVRLLAPLTIPDAVLEEGLNILAAAIKDATRRGVGARGGLTPPDGSLSDSDRLPRRGERRQRSHLEGRGDAEGARAEGEVVLLRACGGPAGLKESICTCA